MPAFTLEQANTQLAAYIAAETKVLAGQSATLGDRSVTLADLATIQKGILLWSARVDEANRSELRQSRCRTVSPRW